MEIYVKEFFLLLKNKIPEPKKLSKEDKKLKDNLNNEVDNLVKLIDRQDLNNYIKKVVEFSFDANKYFNDSEPWAIKKTDPDKMSSIIYTVTEQIKNISILLNPIMPESSAKVLDIINIESKDINMNSIKRSDILNHSKKLKKIKILFPKIENDN